MKQNRHTVDQIIAKLRRADVELGKGKKVPEICKLLEITDQTYYRWRQKYGGMQPEMAKQLKSLQKENSRLKKLVAEQALDMEILKEAAQGSKCRRRASSEETRQHAVVQTITDAYRPRVPAYVALFLSCESASNLGVASWILVFVSQPERRPPR